ncbi:MAG: hypothetical protein AAGU32_12680, partial [Bacillota bacterium]
ILHKYRKIPDEEFSIPYASDYEQVKNLPLAGFNVVARPWRGDKLAQSASWPRCLICCLV